MSLNECAVSVRRHTEVDDERKRGSEIGEDGGPTAS